MNDGKKSGKRERGSRSTQRSKWDVKRVLGSCLFLCLCVCVFVRAQTNCQMRIFQWITELLASLRVIKFGLNELIPLRAIRLLKFELDVNWCEAAAMMISADYVQLPLNGIVYSSEIDKIVCE